MTESVNPYNAENADQPEQILEPLAQNEHHSTVPLADADAWLVQDAPRSPVTRPKYSLETGNIERVVVDPANLPLSDVPTWAGGGQPWNPVPAEAALDGQPLPADEVETRLPSRRSVFGKDSTNASSSQPNSPVAASPVAQSTPEPSTNFATDASAFAPAVSAKPTTENTSESSPAEFKTAARPEGLRPPMPVAPLAAVLVPAAAPAPVEVPDYLAGTSASAGGDEIEEAVSSKPSWELDDEENLALSLSSAGADSSLVNAAEGTPEIPPLAAPEVPLGWAPAASEITPAAASEQEDESALNSEEFVSNTDEIGAENAAENPVENAPETVQNTAETPLETTGTDGNPVLSEQRLEQWAQAPSDNFLDVPVTVPSRAAAHVWSIVLTLLLIPVTWFGLMDAANSLMFTSNSPWTTGNLNFLALGEIAVALILLLLLALVARASALGATIFGFLLFGGGLAGLLAPAAVKETMTAQLAMFSHYSSVGANVSNYLLTSLGGGLLVFFGMMLLCFAFVSHTARRAGRHEGRAQLLKEQYEARMAER